MIEGKNIRTIHQQRRVTDQKWNAGAKKRAETPLTGEAKANDDIVAALLKRADRRSTWAADEVPTIDAPPTGKGPAR